MPTILLYSAPMVLQYCQYSLKTGLPIQRAALFCLQFICVHEKNYYYLPYDYPVVLLGSYGRSPSSQPIDGSNKAMGGSWLIMCTVMFVYYWFKYRCIPYRSGG